METASIKTSHWRGVWIAGVLFLLWWTVCKMGIWSSYLLPSPKRVWNALVGMAVSGELAEGMLVSISRVACGFSLAFLAAFILGVLSGAVPRLAAWLHPVIDFLRNIPPLSLVPLLILWFGIGEPSKVALIFLAAFFPMFLNIEKGISGCNRQLLEVGRVFGFSQRQIFLRILLPGAIPDILIGMQIGLGYSWRAIVGAEMIAAASGLGYLILDAQYLARTDKVIAGILVIGATGYLCNLLFLRLNRSWRREEGADASD